MSEVRSAVLGLIPVVVVLGMDLWLYTDAKAQANSGRPVVFSTRAFVVDTPEAWFVGSLLLWVVFIPLYFSSRNQHR
jgi:cytochrome c oxidase assembly factor CtaG